MAGFSLEKSRKHVAELGQEVNAKKGMVEKLESAKAEVIAARTEIERAGISEEYKETIVQALEVKREQISEQGEKIGDELGKDLKEIETEIQEAQEAGDSNAAQQKNLESKKSVLEKFGMGGMMEGAISQLQNEGKQIEGLKENIIELRKEADDTVRKADAL